MKNLLLILLFSGALMFSGHAQWTKTGPYNARIAGLLLKDSSVLVSNYSPSNSIYISDSSKTGWIKQDSGLVFLHG